MNAMLMTWAVSLLGAMAEDAMAPWASNHLATDVARRHVQEITSDRAEYKVVQRGTMDGRNCRSPQGVWQPFEQTWESNRSVRMENIGETDVVNPWLVSGGNDFRSLDRIVARAILPGMTESDKARALRWQEIQHRFHLEGDNEELLDPVKVFNVYGYNTCGNDSICLAGLWRKAGFKVAPARLVGHCVTQVFYGGSWHLMDGDMHSIYLLRDNETIAGEQELVRDHDLIRRTHTQGILQPDRREGDEWESNRYPVAAIRSLGDLRTRVVNGKETMSFWDVERLRFDVERGPRWLTIDRTTGLLSGTPDRAGKFEVTASVTLERGVRLLDQEALKWGIE
jgi:hypothetical protein